MQRLLSPVETLQVLHHLLHVLLGVAVLDVGEPAATHADDNGHHQHEVLQVVVTSHCKRAQTLLDSKNTIMNSEMHQRGTGEHRAVLQGIVAQDSPRKAWVILIFKGKTRSLTTFIQFGDSAKRWNSKSSNLPGSKWYRRGSTQEPLQDGCDLTRQQRKLRTK